tara:strand:- start:125 stop:463 length:339 start_codon:yes stop_codon:yes gene_type:complete
MYRSLMVLKERVDMVAVVDMMVVPQALLKKELMLQQDLVVEVHGDLVDNLHHQVDHKEIMVVMDFQVIQETMLLAVVVVPVALVLMEVIQVLVDMVVLAFKCQQHLEILHHQ